MSKKNAVSVSQLTKDYTKKEVVKSMPIQKEYNVSDVLHSCCM